MNVYHVYAFVDPEWEDCELSLGFFQSQHDAIAAVEEWLGEAQEWEDGPRDDQIFIDLNDYTSIWISPEPVGEMNGGNLEAFWNRVMYSAYAEHPGPLQ